MYRLFYRTQNETFLDLKAFYMMAEDLGIKVTEQEMFNKTNLNNQDPLIRI